MKRKKYLPKIFIFYHRLAFIGKRERDLRITLDDMLCCRNRDIDLSRHGDEETMLKDDEIMLEVKACHSMPLWLVESLSCLHLQRTSFSKYRTAFQMADRIRR